MKWFPFRIFICLIFFCISLAVYAHHVLGRPSYSLSEDSNTPPSMQIETQVGNYFVTYMAFPAFPKPNEQGRVNLYASRIDNGVSYQGKIRFKVRDDSWFAQEEEVLGEQEPDDSVFRQGFVFSKPGNYIITAEFEAEGDPYQIEFPLQIGEASTIGPLGLTVAALFTVLIVVSLIQRRRLQRMKIRRHHVEAD